MLVWDQTNERRYETGTDRGVLYVPDGPAVPWNGLVSVTESTSRTITPFYLDGVKFLDQQKVGEWSGKISAFTYPDELDALTGVVVHTSGALLHDQRARPFHLAYRTRVGNPSEGIDFSYKLHVIYNILAKSSDSTIGTIDDAPEATAFEWDLSAVPIRIAGHRATAHISLDSRRIASSKLAAAEAVLYGTEDPATIPALADLLALLASS